MSETGSCSTRKLTQSAEAIIDASIIILITAFWQLHVESLPLRRMEETKPRRVNQRIGHVSSAKLRMVYTRCCHSEASFVVIFTCVDTLHTSLANTYETTSSSSNCETPHHQVTKRWAWRSEQHGTDIFRFARISKKNCSWKFGVVFGNMSATSQLVARELDCIYKSGQGILTHGKLEGQA